MKNTKILLLLLLSAFFLTQGISAQTKEPPVKKYNEELAKKLGADDYGMKKYVVAFLKSGKAVFSKEESAKIFQAHLNNIVRLSNEGKMIVAGPFLDGRELRGIYIFNVETIEEAQKLTESDPAIKAGALIFELHPWYGSAALQEILQIHKTIEKKSVAN
jgi:uncharacterized protein YciI